MAGLKNKVALVTGSSRSIGRAIAERLGRDGASVIIHYNHQANEAQNVVTTIQNTGVQAVAIQAELTQVAEIRRLFTESLEHFGKLDIFVANAGVPLIDVPIVKVTEEQFDQVYAVNTRAVFFALQEAARQLQEGGRIINISSSTTVHPTAGFSVYASSKAAPKLIVEVLSQELGERQITVNSVVVGPTDLGFLDDAADAEKQRMAKMSPFNRMGTPEDAADVVAFLASMGTSI